MTSEIYTTLSESFASVPVTSTGFEMKPDWNKMDINTLAHLAWHGLKQKLNDPNGAKDLSDSEKNGNSRKVLDSLEANEVRMVSGRTMDPVEAELMKQARAIVANKLLSKGHKLKDYKLAAITKLAEDMLVKYPELAAKLRSNAEAAVATANEAKATYANIEI